MAPDNLSALVSSRICHDLISPIGAIANGVELLTGFSNQTSPELGLIGDSAAVAAAKLRYFRIAFGAAKPGSELRLAELEELMKAMFSSRFRVVLAMEGTDISRATAKCILLALLCVEKTMPLGGETRVTSSEEGASIDGTGSRIKVDQALWDALESPTSRPDLTSAEVQFAVLSIALAEAGASVRSQFSETTCQVLLTGFEG